MPVTPPENYHYLSSMLMNYRHMSELEECQKQAQSSYRAHVTEHVRDSLAPFADMQNLFDGISERLASGVSATEIAVDPAYSKEAVKSAVAHYSGKKVEKILANLYKRLRDQLGDTGLLQVVWRSIQDELSRAFESYQSLIDRCYPRSGITLEFTMNDLRAYLSNVAKDH